MLVFGGYTANSFIAYEDIFHSLNIDDITALPIALANYSSVNVVKTEISRNVKFIGIGHIDQAAFIALGLNIDNKILQINLCSADCRILLRLNYQSAAVDFNFTVVICYARRE